MQRLQFFLLRNFHFYVPFLKKQRFSLQKVSPFFALHIYQHVSQAYIGFVDGVDVGLGLFARSAIPALTYLGEYAGVLSTRRGEDDGVYGYGLPVVDPDLVINAKV